MAAPIGRHVSCQIVKNFVILARFNRQLGPHYCLNTAVSSRLSDISCNRRCYSRLRGGRRPRKILQVGAEVNEQDNLQESTPEFVPVSQSQWPYTAPKVDVREEYHLQKRNKRDEVTSSSNPLWKEGVKTGSRPKSHRNRHVKENETVFDDSDSNDDFKVHYERIYEGDKRFGQAITACKSRKQRHKTNQILLEGQRLITDAILAGAQIQAIYFTYPHLLRTIPIQQCNAKLYKVGVQHMKIWSDVDHSPGLLALCKIPTTETLAVDFSKTLPITLVCDNVRDPGNMGTILRCAAAVGCRSVLATKGCVDVWSPKVLRAAAGCHFRAEIKYNLGWETISNYIPEDANIYLADSDAYDLTQTGQAVPEDVMRKIVKDGEENPIQQRDERTKEVLDIDESYLDTETVELFRQLPLHSSLYSDVAVDKDQPSVLVIGGETEGLSSRAYKFAHHRNGERLVIPMMDGVDSLNSGISCAIILYELRKHYSLQQQDSIEEDETAS